MAFSVTPTSGVAPYVFSLSVAEKYLVDGINYTAEFRGMTSSGTCPVDGLFGSNNSLIANALLSSGSYSASGSIAVGSCRAFTFLIKRLADNVVVSQSTVFVNNVV